jgi:transcription elongation factor GreA
MIMAQYYVTEKGYHRLKEEMDRLEKLVKHDIAKEIAAAASHGDLKENAEYHAAKEKQVHYANKLRDTQERFAGANVVRKEELLPEDAVTFGKRIKIKDVNSGAERVCIILGEGETDPDQGIIAYTSPLARALIGKKQGDVGDVQLPVGVKTYEILEVEFFEDFKD